MKSYAQTLVLSALSGVLGIALGYWLFSPPYTAEQLLAAEKAWIDPDVQRLKAEDSAAMVGACEFKSLKVLPSGMIASCGEAGWELPGKVAKPERDRQQLEDAWNRLEGLAIQLQETSLIQDEMGRFWVLYEAESGLKAKQVADDLNRRESQAIPLSRAPFIQDGRGRIWALYEAESGLKTAHVEKNPLTQ